MAESLQEIALGLNTESVAVLDALVSCLPAPEQTKVWRCLALRLTDEVHKTSLVDDLGLEPGDFESVGAILRRMAPDLFGRP
jgi:hypothetical protein